MEQLRLQLEEQRLLAESAMVGIRRDKKKSCSFSLTHFGTVERRVSCKRVRAAKESIVAKLKSTHEINV